MVVLVEPDGEEGAPAVLVGAGATVETVEIWFCSGVVGTMTVDCVWMVACSGVIGVSSGGGRSLPPKGM